MICICLYMYFHHSEAISLSATTGKLWEASCGGFVPLREKIKIIISVSKDFLFLGMIYIFAFDLFIVIFFKFLHRLVCVSASFLISPGRASPIEDMHLSLPC